MGKIMIIEDDKVVSKELATLLELSGYTAEILCDFENSLDKISEYNPDLILLDINIPCLSGDQLLQNLRKVSDIPVIIVTSNSDEINEVLCMSYGADDYVTKPYNPTILKLRISAVLKRVNKNSDILTYGNLSLDICKGTIKTEKSEISLTKNEMLILQHLFNNRGHIVSRDSLITILWNNAEYINENALTVNVSRIRSKLSELGYEDVIETRKGQGYILV